MILRKFHVCMNTQGRIVVSYFKWFLFYGSIELANPVHIKVEEIRNGKRKVSVLGQNLSFVVDDDELSALVLKLTGVNYGVSN